MDRRRFLAASALTAPLLSAAAAPATAQPLGRISPAADTLAAQGWRRLAGRRLGIVSNPTGVLRDGTHAVDSMVAAGVRPTAVFGPEHGFRGTAQAGGSEGDYLDPRTGIPVYDAYGATAAKLAAQFTKAGVDTVVFDIADVGARFYTYIWTMYTAMSAAKDLEFIVLDRPNPIGGSPRGPTLDPAYASGVGRQPIVQQHGMTVGELARLFGGEFLSREVTVERVTGWRRDHLFADTGLTWVPPSPNMPTPQTALTYPGTCLFEGTVLSEGRGTTRPFEIIGAPGLDWRWAEELNALGLPGVRFREQYFVPTFGKFVGGACGGVHVHITDERRFEAIRTSVAMLVTVKRLFPAVFAWRPDLFIDKLTGSDRLRRMVDAGADTAEIVGAWQAELADFRRLREPYLLYR
ncbi:exo-beta-N-acetylmuramidase NamZ family protein [Actinokineospora sp.]|uniref:exo-beta-N-acetylmuramidase NamZ family protein n=1 Tax=Actinokineospora sp. TaxID=1872133 RepID=UPI003D6A0DAB